MFETTEELKWLIFDSEEERRAFVAQRIVAPSRYCAAARSTAYETFIAVLVQEDQDPIEGCTVTAFLFIPADEVRAKSRAALAWCFALLDCNVTGIVVAFTLTPDLSDFATLVRVVPEILAGKDYALSL